MESIAAAHPTLSDTLALLAQTPAALDALLRPLPPAWIENNEGGATWTPREVIAHLIDCEHTNWIPRARFILERNEVRILPHFTRTTGGEEEKTKPLGELLDTLKALRAASLAEVESWRLTPADLERQAMHPAFGAVTLAQLFATWSTHDLTHLHQITRTLAHQQRAAVGPWIKFLGVLHCNGHGE